MKTVIEKIENEIRELNTYIVKSKDIGDICRRSGLETALSWIQEHEAQKSKGKKYRKSKRMMQYFIILMQTLFIIYLLISKVI